MSIKLIAVDMDGTFLSDAKTYNRERFLAQRTQRDAPALTAQLMELELLGLALQQAGCYLRCRAGK